MMAQHRRKPDRWDRRWLWIIPMVAVALSPSDVLAPPEQPDAGEEEEDLAERLIRQVTGDEEQGIMQDIMRLMDRSARQLKREFDPGQPTQALQRQIVEKLDEAIAAAQRRKSKSASAAQRGSRRRSTPAQPKPTGDTSGHAAGDQPTKSKAAQPGITEAPTATGRFRESRRGWGHLPRRDRDEILQGIDEDVLEKYRHLVEDYFRALAEDDEE